jgi:hypothetical protein
MLGSNEVRLCAAAMIEAMQEWADEHLVDPVVVEGVTPVTEYQSTTFVIKLKPPAEPAV